MSRRKTLIMLVLSLFCFSGSLLVTQKFPSYFPEPVYALDSVSQEQILLGRALFYDPILSSDNTISCASCHSPYNAFAHTDHDLSHGINDEIGTRNAPALFNLAWQKNLMWDGASNHLDVQALAPITHPGEMNESIGNIVEKLRLKSGYAKLFSKAYGNNEITSKRILKALTAFQLTLISANAKYDRVQKGEEQFTVQEFSGYRLFKTHCNTCHAEPLFTNHSFANNGLPIDTTLRDYGRWKVTQRPQDSLLFKVPSLRNLSYTFPYMHDGRFKKLNEVLAHYAAGITTSETLAPELQQGIKLSSNEKADIIAFLLTLNDQEFVFNPDTKYPLEIWQSKKE